MSSLKNDENIINDKQNSKEILHNYVTKKFTSQPYSCQWISNSCSVITVGKKTTGGISKGDIKIHQLEFDDTSSEPKLNLVYENEFTNPFRCMSFFKQSNQQQSDNRKFITGDFNGQISEWDSDICDIPIWGIKNAHQGCISAIDAFGDNLVVCGGKDGTIKVYDTRIKPNNNNTSSSSSLITTFEQTNKNNCWSICTNDNNIISGFENGDLNIYNLKTNTIQSTIKVNGGICSIDSNDRSNILNQFLITTNKSFISEMSLNKNSNNNIEFKDYEINKNPNQTIWSGVYSPWNKKDNENIFTVAQGDGSVSMYRDDCKLIDRVLVSDLPILSLDYSKDRKGLLCCISLKKQLSILISPY
ncbi:hypothetical protein RB653_005193 [Dictyostelium firmibasis]|uniref:WD repeat-containing protein 92 homolog n=1 Tax=Dictyostelium firmibasis TaxID=79012 RepID=A0AAN7Z3X7_9MYCE